METEESFEDLMTDAQDSYFVGNLEETVRLCSSALSVKADNDAYDLLCLALLESTPPKYSECLTKAVEWSTRCGESAKQLFFKLRVAYYANDKNVVADCASKLLSQANEDVMFNVALAASLISDSEVAYAKEFSKFVKELDRLEEEERAELKAEDDHESFEENEELTKMDVWQNEIFLNWVNLTSNLCPFDEVLKSFEKLHSSLVANKKVSSHKSVIGLNTGLWITALVDRGLVDQVLEVLQKVEQDFSKAILDEDDNIRGALALFRHLQQGKTSSKEVLKLAEESWKRSTPLIKKRLEQRILFVK